MPGGGAAASGVVVVGLSASGADPSIGARAGALGGQLWRSMSTSNSCLASSIAFLNPIGSLIILNFSMPTSAAVMTSRSPKPKIRPKNDCSRRASLIFSSELSVEVLLSTPPTCITRRLVMTYSWFR